MSNELSRRQILKLVGYASAGTAAVGSVPLLSKFFAEKANAQTTTTPFVRENIYTFMQSPAKVEALREGVRAMKARDSNLSDRTSWAYQANIHTNFCDHGSFFFLPWHRIYLYYFERILRQASGDNTLAIPYWNYSNATERILPEPFRIPDSTDNNPLYVSRRNDSVNRGIALRDTITSYTSAFRSPRFFHTTTGTSFGGPKVDRTRHVPRVNDKDVRGLLEKQPHGQIHPAIGGWMAQAETAAQDPIFWLHHANIDRLWELWLRRGEGQANPTDTFWRDYVFTFYDENNNQVQMSPKDVLDTARQLNYVYDNYDDPSATSNNSVASSARTIISDRQIVASTPQEVRVAGGNKDITFMLNNTPLTLTSPPQNLFNRRVLVESSTINLNVIGVEYDPKNPISYDIYINLPQGTAPDPYGPHYAGILSLFALPQKGTFGLDITDVVSNLQKRNLITSDSISITFILPADEKPRNRRRRGRSLQVQQAVRFKGITIAIESL